VSLVPRKLRRLRKKHQGSSHERSAKKEARKARKARQDEIRLREAPLKQKEKELSRELKQAKRRERDIIKKRRKIRREQKKLRKQRRRAGKKKIVAASLNDMDPSIPSRVVSHLIQTGDLLSMDAPKTHHQARAEESFDRASESLLALTHAAMGSYPVLESGNHWLDDEVFGDDDDDDAIVYVDDDDVETFDQVPPQAQQGLMDWLDAWLDGFRPAPSDSRVYHRPRAVFAYAGEQMAKILAQHPNAIQNGLVDAWHDVHDAFTEMMEHVRHQQRIQAIPNPSSSSAMPAVSQKRVRTVVAKTHESRLKAIDALNRWAKSF